jgi:hypothetical protein
MEEEDDNLWKGDTGAFFLKKNFLCFICLIVVSSVHVKVKWI